MKNKNKIHIKRKKKKKLLNKNNNIHKNIPNKKSKTKFNLKVVILSIIGLIALVLTFTVNWLFIIIPAIVIWINQKELSKRKKK
ncbi:hypothetical protein GOV12_00885 [Candidatus Pacearchaeota archaeon]|nr:hypothetical protein [Candidatus Pacearchaeota archaeon]